MAGKSERLLSLDVMRGITIAGMIMVNNPGSWSTVYAPLLHAEWNGLTPTDLVFPFFMFILGVSCFVSLRKFSFRPSREVLYKITKRSVLIFAVGILLGWFGLFFSNYTQMGSEGPSFFPRVWRSLVHLENIRILGVMQRLALCYGITSLIAVSVRHKHIPYIIAATLAVYYLILVGCNGFEPGEGNRLCNIDRYIWGERHMYIDRGVEPEGLLSTISSVCHALIGFCCGSFIFRSGTDNKSRMLNLFIAGVSMAFAGFLLSYGCPVNKKIWSPTFVLVTCGLGASFLALLIWIIDEKKVVKPFRFFESFGINPLAIYVLSGILATLADVIPLGGSSLKYSYYTALASFTGPYLASLLCALTLVAICWLASYVLYRKRIYIKL